MSEWLLFDILHAMHVSHNACVTQYSPWSFVQLWGGKKKDHRSVLLMQRLRIMRIGELGTHGPTSLGIPAGVYYRANLLLLACLSVVWTIYDTYVPFRVHFFVFFDWCMLPSICSVYMLMDFVRAFAAALVDRRRKRQRFIAVPMSVFSDYRCSLSGSSTPYRTKS